VKIHSYELWNSPEKRKFVAIGWSKKRKELETIKKIYTKIIQLMNAITEVKNSIKSLDIRLDKSEESVKS
jgi:hypothetical protein